MSTHEPAPVAILAARIMRAYPSLSPYSAASLATELSAIERAQRRHAERCCSGADGGYVKVAPSTVTVGSRPAVMRSRLIHDPDAEQRAGQRIERKVRAWEERVARAATDCIPCHDGVDASICGACEDICPVGELQGDPRGPVLLVRLPGEADAVAV